MSQARRQRRAAKRAAGAVAPRTSARSAAQEAPWIAFGLILAVAITYWPVHSFGFVRFDDPLYVTENPHIVNGVTWSALKWAFTSSYAANWHPVTWISHMVDVQLYGFNAGPQHITNVVMHALTTALLFGTMFRATGALWRSAVVAALFGLHPIHVESVAWIAERKDVLSAFFWMLTLWLYVGYARQPRATRYALVAVSFAIALMAKPMVVTLPFALLLFDLWPLHRFELRAGWWTALRPLVAEKVPLFAMSVISSAITVVVQQQGGTIASSIRLPLVERLGNAMIAYVAYVGKTLWPLHLAAYYPYPASLPTASVMLSGLVLLAALLSAVVVGRRCLYLLVGALWYLGTLTPAIGIVQVGTQAMADRYTYIPLIGIFIIIAWGVPDVVGRLSHWRAVTSVLAAAGLLLCVVTARAQVYHWESSITLWKHALDVTTDNYAAHTYYGNALVARGDLDGAVREYTEAIRIRPDYPEAHNNLGPALARQGKLDEAIAQFTEAIRLRPNYADARSNLGVALASKGRFDDAVAQYTEALRLNPDQPNAHTNLGLALQASGKTAAAMQEFEIALRMNPNSAEARRALAALQPKQ